MGRRADASLVRKMPPFRAPASKSPPQPLNRERRSGSWDGVLHGHSHLLRGRAPYTFHHALHRRVGGRDPTKGGLRPADAPGLQAVTAPIRLVPRHVGPEFLLRFDACFKAFQNNSIYAKTLMPPNVLIQLREVGHPSKEIIDGHRKLFESRPRHRRRLKLDFGDDRKATRPPRSPSASLEPTVEARPVSPAA
jgi:hypothetical protein